MIDTPRPGSLSFVIPVLNERESLAVLHSEIVAVADSLDPNFEIVFVDDGSTDGSWDAITILAAKDTRVKGLRFRRNFGKAAALAAGFSVARHETVFTLDADLQDDPKEIPNFLKALGEGKDVVSGWKQIRHDPWHKVFPSRVFNGMVSSLTGVKLHDHNCGFKAYRHVVVKTVSLYGELHRFVPVLAAAQGFKVGEIPVQHRARKFGRSKFGARRFLKGFLDLLAVSARTHFGYRPLHLFGTATVVLFVMAVICYGLSYWTPYAYLPAILCGVFGGQSFFTGLLLEFQLGHHPPTTPYVISEHTPSAQ
jgi:dolichol-phosphate mannosyltransferase